MPGANSRVYRRVFLSCQFNRHLGATLPGLTNHFAIVTGMAIQRLNGQRPNEEIDQGQASGLPCEEHPAVSFRCGGGSGVLDAEALRNALARRYARAELAKQAP